MKTPMLSSQVKRESKRRTYARMRLLCKIVHGMDERLMQMERETLELKLGFSAENCRLLSTGLRRRNIRTIAQGHYLYYEISPMLWAKLRQIIKAFGFCGDSFYNDPFDDLCILVSPGKEAGDFMELAEAIEQAAQTILEQYVLGEGARFCVTTAVSEPICSYEQIQSAFEAVQHLRTLEFFRMEPCVLTKAWEEENRRPCGRLEISEAVGQCERLAADGDGAGAAKTAERLFDERLFPAMDEALCGETLSLLKDRLLALCSVYDLGLEERVLRELELSKYATAGELKQAVCALLFDCAAEVEARGKKLHWVARKAVQFMKLHYAEGVAQRDVAEAIGVVPQYLSSVFNREMGVGVPAYLTALRMERAKELLKSSALKTSQVAEAVGLESPSRFYALFKRYEGCTPAEYREKSAGKR